jgi:hypothetical protein
VSDDIAAAVEEALDGKTGSDPVTVRVSGVNLGSTSHYTEMLYGLAAGIPSAGIALDLSDCTGTAIDQVSILASVKARFVSVTLPDTLIYLTNSAFNGWNSLKEIHAPNTVEIGASAFSGCTALETADLPLVTSIGTYAFSGCTSLDTVNLPLAETIGAYAFQNCTALTDLTLGSTPPSVTASSSYGIFYGTANGTGAGGTITIHVPSTAAYSGWPGVGTAVTDTSFYGSTSKKVLITDL